MDRDEIDINSDWVRAVMDFPAPHPPAEPEAIALVGEPSVETPQLEPHIPDVAPDAAPLVSGVPASIDPSSTGGAVGLFFAPDTNNATDAKNTAGAWYAPGVLFATAENSSTVESRNTVEPSTTVALLTTDALSATGDPLATDEQPTTDYTTSTLISIQHDSATVALSATVVSSATRRPTPRPIHRVTDGLTPGQYAVYSLMYGAGKQADGATHIYKGGYADLGRLTGLSKRGLQNIIAELQAKRVIRIHQAPGYHRTETSAYLVPSPDEVLAAWHSRGWRYALGKSKTLSPGSL